MLKFEPSQQCWCCFVQQRAIHLPQGQLPQMSWQQAQQISSQWRQIGEFAGQPVLWLETKNDQSREYHSLRDLLNAPAELFNLAGKATQLSHMCQNMAYCGVCGGQNALHEAQLAMQCQSCQQIHYPQISPCIIVAVRKDETILLAQHPRHKTGLYTVIAGFVETGETIEQCVAREVFEETGIEVTNVRYFASQPWPFPSNIMLAYLADYRAGEINPDYSELTDAAWFKADELPLVAPPGTIARALIDHTLDAIKADHA
ncbi:NADH pyrophosphatase [Vibrio stylophorae]|uniref:NAD(+) diphosphatase n=1 Tax=Vibrio stylophorae TaxID=659351 RepID=A0ABM8ZQ01_9VIBR|nr:NAD(+) diphosphatase [Vibrio stylophorae]CAH0532371.1 NADH pyrophosphatase [Vibrio stylophorae]